MRGGDRRERKRRRNVVARVHLLARDDGVVRDIATLEMKTDTERSYTWSASDELVVTGRPHASVFMDPYPTHLPRTRHHAPEPAGTFRTHAP